MPSIGFFPVKCFITSTHIPASLGLLGPGDTTIDSGSSSSISSIVILSFLTTLISLLNIPINMIIKSIVGISNISKLPTAGAIILVVISVGLTMIAGLIPARFAAKRDPVEALRTE